MSLQFTERYNLRKIAYIYTNIDKYIPQIYTKCNNNDELLKEKAKLKCFLEYVAYNDGVIEVNYDTDKNGRIFGTPFTIQNISGKVRNFLLEDEGVVDIDIVNSISAVLLSLCNKYDLECDTLEEYYSNRQHIIDTHYDGDKDKCKDFVNPSFFKDADWDIKLDNDFEVELRKDIITIQNFVYGSEDFKKYKERAIETCKRDGKNNFKGRTLNYLYHDMECGILKEAMEFYKKQTLKEIRTPMFDGFIAEKCKSFKLSSLNNLLSDLINADIKFIYKPIEQDIIKMPTDFQYDNRLIKAEYLLKLFKKENICLTESDDSHYANIINLLYKQDFIFQDKKLYIYFNGKWYENNDHLAKKYIQDKIIDVYTTIISYTFNTLRNEDDDDKRKSIQSNIEALNKSIKKIKYQSTLGSVLEALKTKLSSRLDKVEFDVSLPYVLCFNNIAIDVRTGEEYIVKKTDYITFSTGYDYVKPTKEQMETIKKIIDSIFPNSEIKKTYMSILWTGLTGIHVERFFMANGCGRNGKGLLNELMLIMLGTDYSYTGHINCLTRPIGSGANPELANLNKKRFVKFEEPNDTDLLQLGNIKKITGEAFINARMNYSNDTTTKLDITLLFECNKKPNVNGKIDEAIIDRFVDIIFESYFTNDEEQLRTNTKAKKKEEKFKERDFQMEHRCALFNYIVKYAEKELYIAECVKNRTREYLLDNDELFSWFIENYEKEENAILKVKDVLNDYKCSDLYNNMNKATKRKCNDKNFRQMLESNIELRKYYQDRKYIDGIAYRSIILGWRLKKADTECLIDE